MSAVGLVLGGGGVTGASFHFGALLAINLATGWHPDDAEVVVGTSSGAVVAAVARSGRLSIDALVGDAVERDDLTRRLRTMLFPRNRPRGLVRWARHGLLPGVRKPGFSLLLGSPAPYHTGGIERWVEELVGPELASGWPERRTLLAAYDLAARHRVVFGAVDPVTVSLKRAVAASSAVPAIFEPVEIDGRHFIDGGVASGTSADLVLWSPTPLDLVVVLAPMAADAPRSGATFYERALEEAGSVALHAELDLIGATWPDAELLVLRPAADVLESMRPNPLSVDACVPAFLRTLRSMREQLAEAPVWDVLTRHLATEGHRLPAEA